MNAAVATRRKNAFNLFREGAKLASFDEFPLLRPEIDPQLHLSRNEVDQPFHLICQKDTVIALASGAARVLFSAGSVRYFDLECGDFAYVPGGVAHRVLTQQPGILLRYKASDPGLEAAAWYCEKCGAELDRHVWDVSRQLPQLGYQFACERFNREIRRRTCISCDAVHASIDLGPFRWSAVAEALSRPEES